MKHLIFFTVSLAALFLVSCKDSSATPVQPQTKAGTIVEKFGRISVKGVKLVDKNGGDIALHGMSLFWSQWGGKYYNQDCLNWLRDDFKCTIVRAACGVEGGGYLENQQAEMSKVTTIIDAAINAGIYVIVDWHDHNAQNHLTEAKAFFNSISSKYGSRENIIYEIFNEPLQISWTGVIKPYSEEIIKTIRKNDPDNLILIGSSNWSQDVDVAALNPITDTNAAYSLHFYTSTHKQWLRDKAITAMNRGIALFVSEYGISEANGSGNIDYTETDKWFAFVNQYNLSTCNWSIIDKDETSAALLPGAASNGSWKDSELSVSGKYIRSFLRSKNTAIFESLK